MKFYLTVDGVHTAAADREVYIKVLNLTDSQDIQLASDNFDWEMQVDVYIHYYMNVCF